MNHSEHEPPTSLEELRCHMDNYGEESIEVSADDSLLWFDQDGRYHRDQGAAVSVAKGPYRHKRFYFHGNLHCEDGPAVQYAPGCCGDHNVTEMWCCYGRLHRKDGPALTRIDGSQEWYWYGRLHRKDGPAVVLANGEEQWHWKGVRVSEREHMALASAESI